MAQILLDQGIASDVDYDAYGYYGSPAEGWPTTGVYEFRDRIGHIGSSRFAPEAGRYHLYLAVGCPWAQRAAITVALMGLEEAISFSLVDDTRDGRGWAFRGRHGPDPVEGRPLLRDLYLLTDRSFRGHINVPSLWDRKTRRIVNNNDNEVVTELMTKFAQFAASGLDLYPTALRDDIDALSAEIHEKLNIGVYAIGFSVEQSDYDTSITLLFDLLDRLDARLSKSRFLFGNEITESDVRLWVSLARFDIVYNPLFRVNLRRLVDYPHLWAYARDLYRLPAFSASTNFETFRRAYYGAFPKMNPSGIVVAGPRPDWKAPLIPDSGTRLET